MQAGNTVQHVGCLKYTSGGLPSEIIIIIAVLVLSLIIVIAIITCVVYKERTPTKSKAPNQSEMDYMEYMQ